MASADGKNTAESAESTDATVSKDTSSKQLKHTKDATDTTAPKDVSSAREKPKAVPSTVNAMTDMPSNSRMRPKSNLFFTAFYHLALWTVLALLSGPFFAYFAIKEPNERYPAYYGYKSFLGAKPKLNVIPDMAHKNKKHKTIIKLEYNAPASYEDYVAKLNNFTLPYRKHPNNGIDCTKGDSLDTTISDEDFFCVIDVFDSDEEFGLGPCALPKDKMEADEFDFKFGEGRPCFALKLNKILDYVPDAPISSKLSAQGSEMIESMCEGIEDCCHRHRLLIDCSTDDDNTIFNIYPTAGISLCHWPFRGQPGYLAPFAMIQFEEFAAPGTNVKITCSAKTSLLSGTDIHESPHILTFTVGLLPQGTTTE